MFWTLLQDHIFPICLLWRHKPSFLLKQECRPAPGLPILQSLERDSINSMETLFTLSSESLRSLYQSSPLTPQHTPCLYDHSVFSLGLAERKWLFRFNGVLLLTCMLSQEKRPDFVHRWEFGTDYYILLIVKICSTPISSRPNLSQLWHKNTTRSIGLNVYLKSRHILLLNKDE